jgi:hypothetical protein
LLRNIRGGRVEGWKGRRVEGLRGGKVEGLRGGKVEGLRGFRLRVSGFQGNGLNVKC